jgi:hypothetical protein
MTSPIRSSTSTLSDKLTVVEVKPGLKFSLGTLKDLLPDVETTLFFGKVYDLDAYQLSNVLYQVHRTDVASALLGEGGCHSTDLQDYVVDLTAEIYNVDEGDVNFSPDVPHGEILPELWDHLEVEVAASIKAVAEKLAGAVDHMPGKQGSMVFGSLRVMNAKRPTLGDYKARIHHAPQKENLVILDVSGSVTAGTVARIIDDVVALSYKANAHLAIVSNTTTHWDPGAYGTDDVLAKAEYGGTYYETLAPLFDRDWGVVVTIADYDSSYGAKEALDLCAGHIDQVLDISLVNRPTFLAECVGQLADDVRPLLVATTERVLRG